LSEDTSFKGQSRAQLLAAAAAIKSKQKTGTDFVTATCENLQDEEEEEEAKKKIFYRFFNRQDMVYLVANNLLLLGRVFRLVTISQSLVFSATKSFTPSA
jgi:hypothetical protein